MCLDFSSFGFKNFERDLKKLKPKNKEIFINSFFQTNTRMMNGLSWILLTALIGVYTIVLKINDVGFSPIVIITIVIMAITIMLYLGYINRSSENLKSLMNFLLNSEKR